MGARKDLEIPNLDLTNLDSTRLEYQILKLGRHKSGQYKFGQYTSEICILMLGYFRVGGTKRVPKYGPDYKNTMSKLILSRFVYSLLEKFEISDLYGPGLHWRPFLNF